MTLLEVERKFAFQPSLLSRFLRNAGAPPFTHLQHMGSQNIHDVYFDVHKPGPGGQMCILAQHGIWVRRRNNAWQAKQRIFDDQQHDDYDDDNQKSKTSVQPAAAAVEKSQDKSFFLRTVFKELSCPREIRALVTRYVPSSLPSSSSSSSSPSSSPSSSSSLLSAAAESNNNFNLHPIANFTTLRQTFLADKRFHVVLDETCFGHRVGEVELLAESGMELHAQKEIDRFMERYHWFFLSSSSSLREEDGKCCENGDGDGDGDGGKVKGKLTAYFEKFPVEF